MPYVSKDANGNITGVFANLQVGYAEALVAYDDPTVVAYLTPNPVPQQVTPLQARKALRFAGLIDQVNSAVSAADAATQDAWQFATSIRRTDPLIGAIGSSLNLTPAAIDHLFVIAASL